MIIKKLKQGNKHLYPPEITFLYKRILEEKNKTVIDGLMLLSDDQKNQLFSRIVDRRYLQNNHNAVLKKLLENDIFPSTKWLIDNFDGYRIQKKDIEGCITRLIDKKKDVWKDVMDSASPSKNRFLRLLSSMEIARFDMDKVKVYTFEEIVNWSPLEKHNIPVPNGTKLDVFIVGNPIEIAITSIQKTNATTLEIAGKNKNNEAVAYTMSSCLVNDLIYYNEKKTFHNSRFKITTIQSTQAPATDGKMAPTG